MMKILTCIAVEHDPRLVILAGIICLLSSYAAVSMLQKARMPRQTRTRVWISAAGASSGFGIWATHFISMLAYDGRIDIRYQLDLTLISLLVVVVLTTLAIAAFLRWAGLSGTFAGASLFGAGVTAMHFTGMAAVDMQADLSWDRGLVAIAVGCVFVFSFAGLHVLTFKRHPVLKSWCSTALMTLGVVTLHFISMAAITVTPNGAAIKTTSLVSPLNLALMIGILALSMLLAVIAAAIASQRATQFASHMERNFAALVRGVTDYAIYMIDPDGTVNSWNTGAERSKGYTASEIVGRNYACFHSLEDQIRGVPGQILARALNAGGMEIEGWRYRKDGSRFWASVVIDPIFDESGTHLGFAKITRDKTREKAAQDRIAEISANLDIALENMSHGLCLFDRNERLLVSNRRFREIFRVPEDVAEARLSFRELLYWSVGRTVDDSDQLSLEVEDVYRRHRHELIASGGGDVVEAISAHRSVLIRYRTLTDGGWVATYEDITERLNSERQISYLARHDGLTGLPNRVEFNTYLRDALDFAEFSGGRVAVMGIDLDRFKEINDRHGHSIGDFVLKTLAHRMTATLREGEFIGRLGGDEFAAVKQFAELEELDDFIARLEALLFDEINTGEFVIRTGGSLGVALYPQDAKTADMLVNNADLAMYRAKGSLKQTSCFYEIEMDEAARNRRAIANELWEAIEKQEFSLNYQVQKSVRTGDVTGYEVLLRWDSPTRGRVPPGDFISIAEECGAIIPIGAWVLNKACREAVGWDEGIKVAVNLSPVQLAHGDIVELVVSALNTSGLDPRRLELEITESTIISDKDHALETLRQIKALGVTVAIDDFGTGYSSLETLRSFPFDKIKLDRSFMMEVESSPQAKAIIRAILALGQSLDVPVLAEGVETLSQLEILQFEGCDEAQGYFLGRPGPLSGLMDIPLKGRNVA